MAVKSKNYNGNNIVVEYESSNLKKAVYDTTTHKLHLTFLSDQTYEYDNVPHETFAQMNLAESQGKYFNQNIKTKFTYRKLIS